MFSGKLPSVEILKQLRGKTLTEKQRSDLILFLNDLKISLDNEDAEFSDFESWDDERLLEETIRMCGFLNKLKIA